jgi:hypothetical protein
MFLVDPKNNIVISMPNSVEDIEKTINKYKK